jgi:predicted RNase H-like nuclease (RuvC/YqgF family)
MNKKNVFKLARLLKLLTEAVTNNGVLVAEGEIEVGSEVFVYNEEGEAVPASDGEYIVEGGEVTIVVANGIVSEMRQKEEAPIEQPEEQPEEIVENEEAVEQEEETPQETPEEEAEQEEGVDIEALKAEIEALKAENAELKAKVAEYEAKEKEAEEPSIDEEDRNEFSSQNGLSDKQKRAASILKYRNEK